MKSSIFLLFISILLLFNKASAIDTESSCGNFILQNEAVNLDNARNQDSVGWCYAYTASDLLSYRLKKRISAVSLYDSGQEIEADISSPSAGKGGDIGDSIRNYLAKNKGLCLESELPSSDFQFCTYNNYAEFLNYFLNSARSFEFDKTLKENLCLADDLNTAFPGIDINTIRYRISRNGSKNLMEYLYKQKCRTAHFSNVKINPINRYLPRVKPDSMLEDIDRLLNNKEVIGVGYTYSKMIDRGERGDHASLIVGRKYNPETRECEYLMRNSMGKECNFVIKPGLTCMKVCDDKGCRYNGHFWVSRSLLKENLIGITYLE